LDAPVFTPDVKGLAPASGGGTANFLRADGSWAAPAAVVGTVAWGTITGTLSAQLDLQAALDGKAAAAHTHIIGDVTGLQAALNGKQPTGNYSVVGHTHVIADVTGLQGALDGKQVAGNYSVVGHTHVIADVTGLQGALDAKAAAASLANYLLLTGGNITGALSVAGNMSGGGTFALAGALLLGAGPIARISAAGSTGTLRADQWHWEKESTGATLMDLDVNGNLKAANSVFAATNRRCYQQGSPGVGGGAEIYMATSAPTAGDGNNGDIWLQYT
jgi:hypothetical protein